METTIQQNMIMETIKKSIPTVKAYTVTRRAGSSFAMFAVPRIEASIEARNEMFAKAVLVNNKGLANPSEDFQEVTIKLPTIQQPLINSKARFTMTNQVKGFFSNAVISDHKTIFQYKLIKIPLRFSCDKLNLAEYTCGKRTTKLVGLPGFEPGSREPESQSLDQASRQPLSQQTCSTTSFT